MNRLRNYQRCFALDHIINLMITLNFAGFLQLYLIKLFFFRWNNIISESLEIMKKYQLNLEESEGIIKRAMQLKRKFQSAKIKNLSQPVLDVFTVQNLKALRISCCRLNLPDLSRALKYMTMLEEFNTIGVNIHDDEVNFDKVNAKKLTSLKLHLSDPIIVELFNVTTLKKFKISSYIKPECDAIVKLLMHQTNLKDFSIGGILCDNFFSSHEVLKFPFKLTDLKIDGSKTDLEEEIEFFKIHSATIERLVLQYPLGNAIHKFAVQSIPKLKHLQLPTTQFTVDMLQNFSPNENVKSLTLYGILKTLATAKKMIDLFPSIENLNLGQVPIVSWSHQFLIYISKTKKIKSLEIPYFAYHEPDNQPFFPNLKEFTVSKIFHDALFDEFVQLHSGTLEKINIHYVDEKKFVKGLTVNKILSCVNLKHVTIGSESPLIIRMFNNKVHRPNSWTLEARIKNQLDRDYVALKFKFPDDIAIWEERCRVYSDDVVREFSTVENYGTNVFVNKYK